MAEPGPILSALAGQLADLTVLLDGLEPADWRRPSPCEGWDVGDVVLHLAQTNELALASVEGRFDDELDRLAAGPGPAASIDDGAALMVERQRGAPGAEVRARWQAGAERLMEALTVAGPHERVMWVAGRLSVRTLATTRLAETWIHTGDVAQALGRAVEPTDRLWHIARLAVRTLPYAFERDGERLSGPVAFELLGPAGDRWGFVPDSQALTTIRGGAVDLCTVAARRADPARTDLTGDGPDVEAVLRLVRTYA